MAGDQVLNIEVRAAVASAIEDLQKLGNELGGNVGAKAQELRARLTQIAAHDEAIAFFREMQEAVSRSDANFRKLSAELVNYERALGQSTDPKHVAQIQQMRQDVAAAGEQWARHREQLSTAKRTMEAFGSSVASAQKVQERLRAEMAAGVTKADALVRKMREMKDGVTLWERAARGAVHSVTGTFGQLREAVLKVPQAFQSVKAKFGELYNMMVARWSLTGLMNAVQEMQDVRVALQAVTGDAKSAGEQFDFVKRVAMGAGADIAESAGQWVKLSAAAKGTALEGKAAQDVFKAVTNAMSNMGQSGAQTGAVLQTLTQIINGEDVSARQLERTLGTQLPGALQAAAKGFGVTEQELRRMLDAGEITAEKLLPALAKGLNETTNAAPPVAKVSDAFNNVKNAINDAADSLGESGLNAALVEGAKIAGAAIMGLANVFIDAGKIIGTTMSAIFSLDFSGYSQALADISEESNQRLAKMAQNNEYVRATLEKIGTASQQAALQAADLAVQQGDAGNAAAAAAPQMEALGMSYKALDEAVGKVKDTEALELEVIQGRIKAAEEDIKMEGLSAEAKLAAQKSLEEARQAELDFYTQRLTKQGELLAAAQEQLKAEQDAAAASEEEKKKREPVIEQLKTLVNMREKDVQKTMEQIKAAQKNAEASSKEARAAEDARKALEAKNKTRKMESDAIIKSLEAQKESARIGEELARQMGNEYQERQFKIQQLEIEVKITLAKADAAHAEAQGSIDVARAQMDELRAKGQLTAAKEEELKASIKLGEARLKEADAIKESARLQQNHVQQVRYSAQASGEATSSAAQGWREVAAEASNARSAVDGYSSAVRNAPPPPSSGGGGGGGSDGGGSSGSSGGGGVTRGKTRHTWKSLYEYAKQAGADEALARELADMQFNQQGGWTGALQQSYKRHKLDFFSDEVAVNRAIEQRMRNNTGINVGGAQKQGGADGATSSSAAAPAQSGTTVNINLNGRRTTIGVGSAADAHQLENLLREIANDQERAA